MCRELVGFQLFILQDFVGKAFTWLSLGGASPFSEWLTTMVIVSFLTGVVSKY